MVHRYAWVNSNVVVVCGDESGNRTLTSADELVTCPDCRAGWVVTPAGPHCSSERDYGDGTFLCITHGERHCVAQRDDAFANYDPTPWCTVHGYHRHACTCEPTATNE